MKPDIRGAALGLFLSFPVAVWAHSGETAHHDQQSFLAAVFHLIREPDHLALLVACCVAVAWAWPRVTGRFNAKAVRSKAQSANDLRKDDTP
jgi:hydrogenase/urease accessory protein HupE